MDRSSLLVSEKKMQSIKILFPCIHGITAGQMATINCFTSSEMKGVIKVVTGVDEEIAGRIIGASRYSESDSRAGIGVIALFSTPFFSGESYGLALALGDKIVRLGINGPWTEIYATGVLPADGCGKVTAVTGFIEKLQLLKKRGLPNSLFLFPRENLDGDAACVNGLLNDLQKQKIYFMAVHSIAELEGKVWPEPEKDVVVSPTPNSKRICRKPISSKFNNKAELSLLLAIVIILWISVWTFFSRTEQAVQQDISQQTITEADDLINPESLSKFEENPHQEIEKKPVKGNAEHTALKGSGDLSVEQPAATKRQSLKKKGRKVYLESVPIDPSIY